MYPVGSVYISLNASFNPNTSFGGSWDRFGQGRCLWGVDDNNTNLGGMVNPGLPNITGTVSGYQQLKLYDVSSGALQTNNQDTFSDRSVKMQQITCTETQNTAAECDVENTASTVFGRNDFNFNANRSSSIYGSSETVQPPAVNVIFWKRTA